MDIENKYGTLKVQQRLLQLLKTFDALCKKNNIVYSVSSGTMLGTIRHQGFIPWDDDVDITIERKYYNRLMAAVQESPTLVSDKDLWLDSFFEPVVWHIIPCKDINGGACMAVPMKHFIIFHQPNTVKP